MKDSVCVKYLDRTGPGEGMGDWACLMDKVVVNTTIKQQKNISKINNTNNIKLSTTTRALSTSTTNSIIDIKNINIKNHINNINTV